MKINYIRNLMASYMVIEQNEEPAAWEKEMIVHSNISGMIFADYVCENGQKQFWYDISGKQALDSFFESVHLNYGMLCMLLMGIYEMLGRLESFLLKPDGLLLRPECIFLDNDGKQVYFCYATEEERELPELFQELMEYLLAQLDHTDDAAVELAYGLYEQAVKEGFCLRELRNLLHMSYEQETEAAAGNHLPKAEENGREESVAANGVDEERKKKVPFIEIISGKIKQKIVEIREKLFLHRKKEVQEEAFVFAPEDEPERVQGRPTVLLSELTKTPEGVLRYEGNGEEGDLRIEELPYIIGSDAACAGYISSSTVSRRHAKITKKEDIYFIEDLNSSNGTYVGGELLNYRTKISLQKNEIVMFADEKFRFI